MSIPQHIGTEHQAKLNHIERTFHHRLFPEHRDAALNLLAGHPCLIYVAGNTGSTELTRGQLADRTGEIVRCEGAKWMVSEDKLPQDSPRFEEAFRRSSLLSIAGNLELLECLSLSPIPKQRDIDTDIVLADTFLALIGIMSYDMELRDPVNGRYRAFKRCLELQFAGPEEAILARADREEWELEALIDIMYAGPGCY